MNINFTFKNISENVKDDMEAYTLTKLDDLERYFVGIPEQSVIVRVTLESMEKHTALKAGIHIEVRHGKSELFQAEEVKHTYTEALDAVKDILAHQISTKFEKLKDMAKQAVPEAEMEEDEML